MATDRHITRSSEVVVGERLVYGFREVGAGDRALVGGKGANLGEMTRLGLPVPPGFTITTEACREYLASGGLPAGLRDQVDAALGELEREVGKHLGDPSAPLFVSVRSGAPVSMPGMMETILNLGVNEDTVGGLARLTGNPRFAQDAYRRFVQMFGKIVCGVPGEEFEDVLYDAREEAGVHETGDLPAEALATAVARFQRVIENETGTRFPQEPRLQLELAIEAVFKSWNGRRAIDYRRLQDIDADLGTAVNVQAMVFGNMGDDSGTGVAFTRDPATGMPGHYGDFLVNAQGEDVVAGMRTPVPLAAMEGVLPEAYAQLIATMDRLEAHYRDLCDIEFTVERGRLYLLQTRVGKRTARAALRIAVDLVTEGLITTDEAVARVDPGALDQLLHPRFDPAAHPQVVCRGVNASPGAAVGRAVFSAEAAEEWAARGEDVILVRRETTPEDLHGMIAARGILTSQGGKTSHAAVVARGMGKPCVCGAGALKVDETSASAAVGEVTIEEGDVVSIDGTDGRVMLGAVPLIAAAEDPYLPQVLGWADGLRRLGVRANADTGEDAGRARAFGAEGIGLCRTEHMFLGDRLPIVQRFILATSPADEEAALVELLAAQRADFAGILEAMDGLPVTVRLLDPPLHEFLPPEHEVASALRAASGEEADRLRRTLRAVRDLAESNPMLGLRGCRLGLTRPGVYEMQTRALVEAALKRLDAGGDPRVEIMIPLVSVRPELDLLRAAVEDAIKAADPDRRLDVKIGTMIETPRAALVADEIAGSADFFSFGTNDLTQLTFAFSRDDAEGKFLPAYLERGILESNPFDTIDQRGVGRLVETGTRLGREGNPGLSVGVCGEHGGDPDSIAFFHAAGLDYVSCSPFRVPAARLAAAHAMLAERAESPPRPHTYGAGGLLSK